MRVLVVSNDASLAVALSLMADNRDVVSIRTADEVSPEGPASFNGAVIDVGTTYGGLEVVRELADAGVAPPFFLLGDVEASVPRPQVDLLVRPFSLEQLDERLSALTRQPSEPSDLTFEHRTGGRFGGSLLARFMRGDEADRERDRGSDLPSAERSEPPPSAAAAAHDVVETQLAAEPGFDVGGDSHVQRPKPQIHPRFRRGTVLADPLDLAAASSLQRVRALMEELEAMVDERSELLDRRVLANGLAEEIERELRPDAMTVWVPREDKTYEAYATRGLDAAVGIRVPQEQSLFVSFQTDVDAVLIAPLDVSQRPVSGIPGLLGESLVASALRLDQTLLGIVVATGTGFTVTDRDRLAFLASRAAPDFAFAGLIERLRARRFGSQVETTKRSV